MSRKFTVEFWLKVFSVDIDIFKKSDLSFGLQNNQFIVMIKNKIIPPVKVKEYQMPSDKWTHLTLTYKKKDSKLRVLVNCEEVVYFSTNLLDELGKKGEISFGCENMEGEMTQIGIWNQVLPIKYLQNSHKSPLPILAENKRKLKMKINKQEEKKEGGTKAVGFRGQSFMNSGAKFGKPRESAFVNQSTIGFAQRGGAAGKSTILSQNVVNSLAQSYDISKKKDEPIAISKPIPEENFDHEVKYPGFTFESPSKGSKQPEEFRAPSFVSVIQQNENKEQEGVNPNFDPNDFKF